MDSYTEVRRVRKEMSAKAGHDIRVLIASINSRWPNEATRAIDPGAKAEEIAAPGAANLAVADAKITPAHK